MKMYSNHYRLFHHLLLDKVFLKILYLNFADDKQKVLKINEPLLLIESENVLWYNGVYLTGGNC